MDSPYPVTWPVVSSPHSPTALMRKPRGGRSVRRHQASRSTCRLAGGACTSSTPHLSQPWKASREAARASREFQKQRALARRKARNTARPPGSSASLGASSLHSTSASEPGASCTGRAMLRGRRGPAVYHIGGRGGRSALAAGAPHAGQEGSAYCALRPLPGERGSGGGVGCAPQGRGGAGRAAWGWPLPSPARRPIGVSQCRVTWSVSTRSQGSVLPAPLWASHFTFQLPSAPSSPCPDGPSLGFSKS